MSSGLRPPGGQERKLSGIARPANQGIPRPGQSRLQAPGQFQRFVPQNFYHYTRWYPHCIPLSPQVMDKRGTFFIISAFIFKFLKAPQ